MGASSSKSMGCERKIYLALRQRARISLSRSFTSLDDLSVSLLIILSISISSPLFILVFRFFNILN
jgi:hypothetical protein